MTGFIEAFAKVTTGDGLNFTLLEPLHYVAKSGETITVPAGITTDGASTPPVLWPTIPPFGKYWLATILHDYLYRFTVREKDECDSLFLEAMHSCGVNEAIAHTMHQGVAMFGWKAFREDREV